MSRSRARAGFSTLEIQVALVVLGIAMTGLCPIVVMQMKLLRRIESVASTTGNRQMIRGQRIVDGVPAIPAGEDPTPPVVVLRASPDAWVRKLGVAATIDDQVSPPILKPIPTEAVVEDAEAALVGDWMERASGEASSGSYRSLDAGDSEGSGTWTFGAIAPAYYRVLLSWPGSIPVPADATFTLTMGDASPVVAPIPGGSAAAGSRWLDLGNHKLGPSATLRLGRSKLGAVVLDAVRIGSRNRVKIQSPPATDAGPDGGFSARASVVTRP